MSPAVPYIPAAGCSDELDGWCNRWCPGTAEVPLLARRIVPTGFDKGSLRWWGCFPRSLVLDSPSGNDTTLRGADDTPDAYRRKYCGRHSVKEKRFFMTLEQRHLIRTFRACKTARDQAGLKVGVSREELALKKKSAFLADGAHAADAGGGPTAPIEIASSVGGLTRGLPRCADGSAVVSILVGSKWGNTFMSKVGRSGADTMANTTSDQIGLQGSLLVTLVYSIRRHETTCRRPYLLLAGIDVTLPQPLAQHLTRLGVSLRRIEPLSEYIPSLNKLCALIACPSPPHRPCSTTPCQPPACNHLALGTHTCSWSTRRC